MDAVRQRAGGLRGIPHHIGHDLGLAYDELHTFPVAACCAMKPRKATIARRPFLISLS